MRPSLIVPFVLAAFAPAGHPHFNDGGTLEWSTNLDAARAAAKSSGRLIFVEYGRAA